jgi:hypothetical protein
MPQTPDNSPINLDKNEKINDLDDVQESSSEEIENVRVKKSRQEDTENETGSANKARRTSNNTSNNSQPSAQCIQDNTDNIRAKIPMGPIALELANYQYDNLATQELAEKLGLNLQHFRTTYFLSNYNIQSNNEISTQHLLRYIGNFLRENLPNYLIQNYKRCNLLSGLDENIKNIFRCLNINPDKFLPLMLPIYFRYTNDQYRSVVLRGKQMPELPQYIDYNIMITLLNSLLDKDLKSLEDYLNNELTNDTISPTNLSTITKFNYPRMFTSVSARTSAQNEQAKIAIGNVNQIIQLFPIIINNSSNLSSQDLQQFVTETQKLANTYKHIIEKTNSGNLPNFNK